MKEGGSLLFNMSLYLEAVQSILLIPGKDLAHFSLCLFVAFSLCICSVLLHDSFISTILSLQLAYSASKVFG